MKAEIPIRNLVEASPWIRNALKMGIVGTKPTYSEINTTSNSECTPAYAVAIIKGKPVSAIIDTGAGISVISVIFLRRIGWKIDRASKRKIIVADGRQTVALGEMDNVTVMFGNCEVPINMTVTEATGYDIILGNDWLQKARAKIDLGAAKMRITAHGLDEEVPLDLYRGSRPEMSDTDSETESTSEETERGDSVNVTHSKKWPKANKPPKEDSSDEEIPEALQRKEDERTYYGHYLPDYQEHHTMV